MEVGENYIIIECDNDVYTAVTADFKSYETCHAGFGDTALEAAMDLILMLMKGDEVEH